ncbi:protein DEEPER ROOTING 1-like [Cornus florida]|uniref:protein DEEPER ROOTING 1-like n=1 Tax=Cornus florida TaxID=4283 RepID=UPI00289A156F|nr:protein DEEPER ROOTING 1-like [Cornus florida]
MKILSWMQRRLDGKHGTRKPKSISSANHHMLQQPPKEEFSDWPDGLLAIGTFGHDGLKEDPHSSINNIVQGTLSSSQDITPEEVGELEKELNLLLNKQVSGGCSWAVELDIHNLPGDDRTNSDTVCAHKNGNLQQSISDVLNRGNDNRLDHTNSAISKKSLSFLLKKVFLCPSGFPPARSLRDPIPQSRMEKIMRTILHKKIYPQSSTTKKYLENRKMPESTDCRDEMLDKQNVGSKWVKTDSEFIVLEI